VITHGPSHDELSRRLGVSLRHVVSHADQRTAIGDAGSGAEESIANTAANNASAKSIDLQNTAGFI
jgi:hypothetical protein